MLKIKDRFREFKETVELVSRALNVNRGVVWTFVVSGVLPVKVFGDGMTKLEFKTSSWGTSYSTFVMTLALVVNITSGILCNDLNFSKQTVLFFFIDKLDMFVLIVCGTLVLVVNLVKQHQWYQIVGDLLRVDASLDISEAIVNSSRHRYIYVAIPFIVYLGEILDMCWLVAEPTNFTLDKFFWISLVVSSFFGLVGQCHTLLVSLALNERFERLNYALERPECAEKWVQTRCKTKWHLSVSQRNRIKRLADVHAILHDAGCSLNSTLSLVSLAFITGAFCQITSLSFNLVMNLLYTQAPRLKFASATLITIILCFINLGIIVGPCMKISAEANRTIKVIHKIYNETKDLSKRKELLLFSRQLLGKNIRFSACGFFPLDTSLFYHVASAVTTYLVILTQFQAK